VTDAVRWLTYDEIATEMGIERESARQLAIRKRWVRRRGNDGKARVGVPEEELQARTADATPQIPSDSPSNSTAPDPSVIQVLTRHISRLEEEIKALKDQHDADRAHLQSEIAGCKQELQNERIISAQVDALRAVVDAERKRVEDLKEEQERLRADRDRWATQAERLAVLPQERRGLFGWLKRA
jgi:predicted RNase H-like nuclease (RuvC/YqgF family)